MAERSAAKLDGRCRVCQSHESRDRVNRLLSYGLNPGEIERCLDDINAKRAKNRRINYQSILNHSKTHFNIQEPVNAAIRRTLERRKREQAEIMEDGVDNLLTYYGFLEVVAQKGFANLMQPDTEVEYSAGLDAMGKLHHLTHEGGDRELAELRRQVGLLQTVVKDVVPEQYWPEISSRLDELSGYDRANIVDAEVLDDEDDYDDDEPVEPTISSDPEDTLEE